MSKLFCQLNPRESEIESRYFDHSHELDVQAVLVRATPAPKMYKVTFYNTIDIRIPY